MARHIAFLRAINVGGHHKIPMVDLRTMFEAMNLKQVETFIASGNVIFESPKSGSELEALIEQALLKGLGYEVRTFVRSDDELAAVARELPFPVAESDGEATVYVGFLSAPPDAAAKQTLAALQTDIDALQVQGRELYWLRRSRESELENGRLEKALKAKATFRNLNTVTKLVAKYPACC